MLMHLLITGLALAWGLILALCWLGWQLLRQNGRLFLRLEELEKRLDEIELGEGEQPTSLPIGSQAPDFDLPDLAGENSSLAKYRGQPVLLIFFNPACGFCREMVPKLKEKLERPEPDWRGKQTAEMGNGGRSESPVVLVISAGAAEANRKLFDEHHLACPVLLQKDSEVASIYKANGTPSGYLIDAEGRIASSLAIGTEGLLALVAGESGDTINARPHPRGEGEGPERASRFGDRSLAGSKIKRDGLKAGTLAPEFRLPRLDGQGELALSELRGRQILLVFSSPGCGPCEKLAPELERFHREQPKKQVSPSPRPSPPGEGELTPAVEVVMVSKGEPKENRAKVKEHNLTFPIVLQQQWEISRRYAMFGTPIAYLIDEQGIIIQDVAVGVEPIRELMATVACTEAAPLALPVIKLVN
jgi:peroxiredoxin